MQDQYSCDIGDFAKFGLLRGLLSPEPRLRLSVLWYLVPDESSTNDGRHISYLKPTPKNAKRFRACDPVLYDTLGALVEGRTRTVSALSKSGLLPKDTAYHGQPLSYRDVPWKDRISWLAPGERITNTSNYDMRSCKALARMTSFVWTTDGPKDVEIVDYH
jgi:hypothetical protein